MANDHYVPRGVIKYWSDWTGGHWSNVVWVFDFATGELRRFGTRQVFAAEGLNSPELEQRVNRLVEAPLIRFIEGDSRGRLNPDTFVEGGENKVRDRAIARALAISFVVQSARNANPTSDSLSKLLTLSDPELDSYADHFWQQHLIGTFTVPYNATLFLNEAGCYWFPYPTPTYGPVWAMALPLNPRTILFAVRREFGMANNEQINGLISGYSILAGAGKSKVVLHNAVVATHGAETIKRELPLMRDATIAHMATVRAAAAKRDELIRFLGFEPPVANSGWVREEMDFNRPSIGTAPPLATVIQVLEQVRGLHQPR